MKTGPDSWVRFRSSLCGVLFLSFSISAAESFEAVHHVKVYAVPGRFGGWPANHGAWSWGNEILVGFGAGYYQDLGDRHNIDRGKPEEHLLARSRDGGETWIIETPAEQVLSSRRAKPCMELHRQA